MSTIAAPQSLLDRHHFLLRRLHSLTGIVPVGAFLINHMLTNYEAWEGAERFDGHVGLIHQLPFLLLIEVGFIFLPLAFHAAYGIVIALQGRSNATKYPYMDNWRYSLQRLTAWITVAFVLVHLVHFRFAHWFGVLDYKEANPYFFFFTRQGFELLLPMGLWMVIYSIGLIAAVFHFCNGIVTFCITWGITINVPSRQKASIAAAGLGVVLLAWGFMSLYALANFTPDAGATPPNDHPIMQHVITDHGTE
ncbi:MAG: succinate dehydrogenase [Phycisphaerae bacterium]|nr:succinate dehydrogenase [Phycisphaerae bacterium]